VNVLRGSDSDHRSCWIKGVADLDQAAALLVKFESFFVLYALNDSKRAPGYVVMDWGLLPRTPDKSNDRKASIELDVEWDTVVVTRVA
jgi:hypothetical protein